jgi:hypothetical protein
MDKFNNWIARKANVIAFVFVVFSYTLVMLFLGMVYQAERDNRVQKIDITTKIIEYRMGNVTLGRDTFNVLKEAPKMKSNSKW